MVETYIFQGFYKFDYYMYKIYEELSCLPGCPLADFWLMFMYIKMFFNLQLHEYGLW
jgi:hypothetical protein